MLRDATSQDLGFVRALVRRPENAPFLTDEDEAALSAYIVDPSANLLIWGVDSPRGFALFRDIGNPSGAVHLLRLALADPGRGEGVAFLRQLAAHAFGPLQARRLWLDVTGENLRAQRVYSREGFTLEGRLRQHEYRPAIGRTVDVLFFGMLRDEWAARLVE